MDSSSEHYEFYVGYQKFSLSEETYEKLEGTALDAILSGRHCESKLFGLPKLDRPLRNFQLLLDYVETGKIPTDRKERSLLAEELKLWCFEDAELLILQEIMHEPLPRSVGDRCLKTWNEIGALDIKKLVDKGIYVIDDALYIEDFETKPKTYEGETNYEGQVDDQDIIHGIGKWTTYQIIANAKFSGVEVDHAKIGCVYEGNFRKGKKSGYGRMIYTDGSYYEGYFCDGKP